jgi:aspartokinase
VTAHQTTFETQRGISSVVVSGGHALVVVAGITENDDAARRVHALKTLKAFDLCIDFLKLSLEGFTFVVPESDGAKAEQALCAAGFEAKAMKGRAIITVSAPNIRDESGLVARIAQTVVRSGASIDSVGDMHSSVLIVLDESKAQAAADALQSLIGKVDVV